MKSRIEKCTEDKERLGGMEMITAMKIEGNRVYVMENKRTGVRIECTPNYLTQWLARGFEVVSIRDNGFSENVNKYNK